MIKTTDKLELRDIKIRGYGQDDDAEYCLQAIINRSPVNNNVDNLVCITVYENGVKYVGVHGTRIRWSNGHIEVYSYTYNDTEFNAICNSLGAFKFTLDVIRSGNGE